MELLLIVVLVSLVTAILAAAAPRGPRFSLPVPPPRAVSERLTARLSDDAPAAVVSYPRGIALGVSSAAPVVWDPVLTGTAYDPVAGLVGSTFTHRGEPYLVTIRDGELVGLPLRTDTVLPVTGGTTLLARRCTVCEDELAADAAFCVSCGQAVSAMAFE